MPRVRCPDCGRDIEVSRDDLFLIIECAVCDARFGPLIQRLPESPLHAALASAKQFEGEIPAEVLAPAPRIRRKRVRARSRFYLLPVLLGIAVGAVFTATLAFAVYSAIKYAQASPAPDVSRTAPATHR
jgi:hypothetical protein